MLRFMIYFVTLFITNLVVLSPAQADSNGHATNKAEARPDIIRLASADNAASAGSVDHKPLHWSYDDPAEWGNLDQKYHLCKDGKRQSPIDITDTTYANLADIRFVYRSRPESIVNNGHSIQINMRHGSYIIVGGKRYDLKQFHFHAPSEHTINGKHSDMVAHFVHQAGDGRLAVIALVMTGCKYNPIIETLWRQMPKTPGHKKSLSGRINVQKLIPSRRDYYNYSGSLTTPPCTEGVNWIVMKRPVEVSKDQVKTFTELFPKSDRPIQDKYFRPVYSRN